MSVIPSQFQLISKLLDATALRHQAISQNIANVNTPGYQRVDVSFEEQLVRVLQEEGSQSPRWDDLRPQMEPMPVGLSRADGNNVDIDHEMGQLTKNSVLFDTYAHILAAKLNIMRSAITGRP